MIRRTPFLITAILTLVHASCLHADVRLPAIFGNHMVLQQDAALPVWGWADPGEKVTVTFGANQAEATAGTDGKWRVNLAPLPAGTPPGTLVVAGKNTLTIQDVLVGDVWICSGQSNMAWGLNGNGAQKMATAAEGQIRLFQVGRRLGVEPCDNVKGSWKIATPQSAVGFSAVGGLFGADLQPVLNRPIGLIESTWGGTRVEAWTSLPAIQNDPAFAEQVADYTGAAESYPGGQADLDAKVADYDAAMKQWSEQLQADTEYQDALKAWKTGSEEAKKTGQPAPTKPAFPIPQPAAPRVQPGTPSALFNSMIAPLVGFAIKGAIWYQGESNASNALEYRKLFPMMIQDWRKRWAQGDFPFLFVQLPNFRPPPKTPDDKADWARVREAQFQTLSLPKTGMAVTIDVGAAENLHPGDKTNVALRLARVARKVAYGEDLVYTGPLFDSMKVEGGQVRITFKPDSLGGGLTIGSAPKSDGKPGLPPDSVLRGFALAGKDQKWVWSDAKIDGESVIVSSSEVPEPIAVRYAWADNPPCNLYNKEGLPASPFRTDDWNPVPVVK